MLVGSIVGELAQVSAPGNICSMMYCKQASNLSF